MGVSVSASFAVVAVGLFIAMGLFHAAATNSYEQFRDASEERRDREATVRATTLNVTAAEVIDATDCTVRVNVTNEGETELELNDTDVLVNGRYQAGWQPGATVDGEADTDVWLPGERLSLNVTGAPVPPNRTKVVSAAGVADTAPVTGGGRC